MTRAASWLEQDPDERIVRWGWMIWLAWGVIGGALFLTDVKAGLGALSLVLVAPFWGLWLLWPVYRAARRWWHWQSEGAWAEWNGTYYEFDGRQIRILMQGDSIWIVADDVFDALELHGRQRNPARVRQIAGRDGLVAARLAAARVFRNRNQGVARSAHRRRCAQVLILAGQAGDHTVSQTSGADDSAEKAKTPRGQ